MTEIDRMRMIADKATVIRPIGRVSGVRKSVVEVTGLQEHVSLGAPVIIESEFGQYHGLIRSFDKYLVTVELTTPHSIKIGSRVWLRYDSFIYPSMDMIGRIIDASGRALDGEPLRRGKDRIDIRHDVKKRYLATKRLQVPIGSHEVDLFNPIYQGDCVKIVSDDPLSTAGLTNWLDQRSDYDVVIVCREIRDESCILSPVPTSSKRKVISLYYDEKIFFYSLQAALALASYFLEQGMRAALIVSPEEEEVQNKIKRVIQSKHPCLTMFSLETQNKSGPNSTSNSLRTKQVLIVKSTETFNEFFKDYYSRHLGIDCSRLNRVQEFYRYRLRAECESAVEGENLLHDLIQKFKPFRVEEREICLEELTKLAEAHQISGVLEA